MYASRLVGDDVAHQGDHCGQPVRPARTAWVIPDIDDGLWEAPEPSPLQINFNGPPTRLDCFLEDSQGAVEIGSLDRRHGKGINPAFSAAPGKVISHKLESTQFCKYLYRVTPGMAVDQQPATISVTQSKAWSSIRVGNASDHPLPAVLPTIQCLANGCRETH